MGHFYANNSDWVISIFGLFIIGALHIHNTVGKKWRICLAIQPSVPKWFPFEQGKFIIVPLGKYIRQRQFRIIKIMQWASIRNSFFSPQFCGLSLLSSHSPASLSGPSPRFISTCILDLLSLQRQLQSHAFPHRETLKFFFLKLSFLCSVMTTNLPEG